MSSVSSSMVTWRICCTQAEWSSEIDVGPDVCELSVRGAISAVVYLSLQEVQGLHAFSGSQQTLRVLDEEVLRVQMLNGPDSSFHDLVCEVQSSLSSCLCFAILSARRAGPDDVEMTGLVLIDTATNRMNPILDGALMRRLAARVHVHGHDVGVRKNSQQFFLYTAGAIE